MDELVIKIKGSLNEKLTHNEIQKQIDKLGKDLKFTIGTDKKQFDELAAQINKLQNEISKKSSGTTIIGDKIVSDTNVKAQKIQKEINKIINSYKKLEEVSSVTSKVNFDPNGNIKGFNLQLQKTNGLIENLKYQLQLVKTGDNKYDNSFVLTNRTVSDRTQLEMQKALQQTLINRQKEERKLAQEQAKASNQNIERMKKEEQQIAKQNQQLEHQINLYKRQAKINVQNLQRTHGGYVDSGALDQYLNSVKQLDVNTPNATKKMQSLNMQFREIQTNAKSAAGALEQSGMSLREMLSTAMTKFPVWIIASTAFYAPIRGLQDMISRLIEIDTLLTDINRVTDMSDGQITDLLNNALTASDQLSSKLTDVLSIMGDFARLGDFNADELTEMASTAQVLTNISDLDAKGSVDALTSAMLNYNIAAKDSIRIADKLNEVNVISLPLQ